MKLKAIETLATEMLYLVRVTDSAGDEGWGMTAPFAANISARVLHQIAAELALQPFDDHTAVADEIIRRQYKLLGTSLARAAASVDTALWDLVAKRKGCRWQSWRGKALCHRPLCLQHAAQSPGAGGGGPPACPTGQVRIPRRKAAS